jgi:hypothetical protein
MGWMVIATPRPLYPRKRPGTHCIGGWVGLRAGLDGWGKSRPRRDSIPDRSALSGSLFRLSYPGPITITILIIIAWNCVHQRCQRLEVREMGLRWLAGTKYFSLLTNVKLNFVFSGWAQRRSFVWRQSGRGMKLTTCLYRAVTSLFVACSSCLSAERACCCCT